VNVDALRRVGMIEVCFASLRGDRDRVVTGSHAPNRTSTVSDSASARGKVWVAGSKLPALAPSVYIPGANSRKTNLPSVSLVALICAVPAPPLSRRVAPGARLPCGSVT